MPAKNAKPPNIKRVLPWLPIVSLANMSAHPQSISVVPVFSEATKAGQQRQTCSSAVHPVCPEEPRRLAGPPNGEQMATISKQWRWILIPIILLSALLGCYIGYGALIGWPATPMTVAEADRLFSQGLQPGSSIDDAKNWLASRGVQSGFTLKSVYYHLSRRMEGGELSMTHRGHQSVAECAGLNVEDVYSVIDVTYPEADRFLLGITKLSVYLFFDKNDQLIRHWIDEFHLMP
jgi:hypothetical protein